MKIYVASAYANRGEVKKIQQVLLADDHIITHDWTNERIQEGWSQETIRAYLRRCADADKKGVEEAEVFVFLGHPDARGAWVEFGMALALNKAILIDPPASDLPNIFTLCPGVEVFYGSNGLLSALERIEANDLPA